MICSYCEWKCNLEYGGIGICGMYCESGGKIKERFPNRYSTYRAVHIESVPFFHVYPGSRSLLIGGVSCNLGCYYCSNSYIAKNSPEKVYMFELKPSRIIEIAKKTGCHSIVFGINEVTLSLPTMVEVSNLAKEAGLSMGCLTNGYLTEESLETLESAFQFINVSLKSLSSEFYEKYIGTKNINPILRNIKSLAKRCHIEITTPIVPNANDHEILDITKFIFDINPEIPWHVFRLLPEYKMSQLEYPNIDKIQKVLMESSKQLPYIYFSNFIGSDWVSTICPSCKSQVIERINMGGCGGKILEYSLENGKCPRCGRNILIYGCYEDWNSRDCLM